MSRYRRAAACAVALLAAIALAGCPPERTSFTEVFEAGNDLDGLQLTFTPTGECKHASYVQTNGTVTDFPSDPTGGLLLDFGAFGDAVEAGTFGGAAVPFYGKLYDTLYIASQGWISFGKEGNTPDSLGAHFDKAQISALPVDATAPGAMVSYLQDDEKLIVTYEMAPGLAKGVELNDFQVEMFFDGVIRLSYVNVDPALDGIVGLSAGGRFAERDFVPSDLSNPNTPPLKAVL